MIPTADILAWRAGHPWVSNAQVEQDLIICRAVIELFSRPVLREQLAFRGGTALHKLFLKPATRYSEDIDCSGLHLHQINVLGIPCGRFQK